MSFVNGQRVRVKDYVTNLAPCDREDWWGDPHFIVGHFGHIESIGAGWFDVRISHGPGGPIDERIGRGEDVKEDFLLWPMRAFEIEAVD